MTELLRYRQENGREPLTEWLNGLRDRVAQARVRLRLRQVQAATSETVSRLEKECWNCVYTSVPVTGSIVGGMAMRS